MLPLVLPFSALVEVRVSKALIGLYIHAGCLVLVCTRASLVPRPEEEE